MNIVIQKMLRIKDLTSLPMGACNVINSNSRIHYT